MNSGGEYNYDGIETRSVEELARSIEQASNGSYAFLIGAGVSRPKPAKILTAGELIEKFQNELYDEQNTNGQKLEEWAEKYEVENKSNSESSYGFWFSKARPTPGSRREEIERLVEGADPPFGQIILANMMDKGIISHNHTELR